MIIPDGARMTDASYLTSNGAQKLRAELAQLKGEGREELAKRLRFAIQQGDLSENADYTAAKEEQGFLEGRIQELEGILRDVIIIDDVEVSNDQVNIGNMVTIQEGADPVETYYLVGPQEADPANGRISHESPIGQALLGRRIGEKVTAKTPAGGITFTIVKIE